MLVWIFFPLISALIGWVTNRMAIRLLFRPRQPVRLPGFTWQGMIPRRQQELASRTAEIIERELLQQHVLRQRIAAIDLQPHLQEMIRTLVQQRLAERLKTIPLIGSFIGESTLQTIERIALEEISQQTGPLMNRLADDLEGKLQIREHIEMQVARFDLDRLEEVVYRVASREFRGIELAGALLGAVIGLLHALLWQIGLFS